MGMMKFTSFLVNLALLPKPSYFLVHYLGFFLGLLGICQFWSILPCIYPMV
jgi:hypothetical protein